MNGVCREGERCHFSHDSARSRPSSVCRYYLRGTCAFGQNCRFDHIRPERLDFKTKNAPESTKSSSSHHQNILDSSVDAKEFVPLGMKGDRKAGKALDLSWVNAPEFVPKISSTKENANTSNDASYAQVVSADDDVTSIITKEVAGADGELCPFYLMSGVCQFGDKCQQIHGLFCEVCQLACLHPNDEEQRKTHVEECTKLMEAEMEHSFAVARSRGKTCGICMDIVLDRSLASERRFGILPNCNHCFCLTCIRKWRQSKQFENKIIRSCPECRTQSDYIIPSKYWVDDNDKEEKDKLLTNYRKALSLKACKYFKQGEGQCPFGNKCFYLHALPDGTKKDVGPPRRRRRINADGELQLYSDDIVLWDFIEEREHQLELIRGSIQTLLLELDLQDLADDIIFADDSFSDTSDS
ncbi:putative E3 ubiquitin-protein ligase makorin-1 isoform X2 [Oratosquilla oratoria]